MTTANELTFLADAGGLLQDPVTSAVTMTVPRTQQAVAVHPSGPQGVAGILIEVLLVVVHAHIIACPPARPLQLSHDVMDNAQTSGHAELCTPGGRQAHRIYIDLGHEDQAR